MKLSDKGKKFLIDQEGLKLKVYLDTAGLPTVGVGHLIVPSDNLSMGDTITNEQAMDFLEDDVLEAEEAINQWVDADLTINMSDALISLIFNIGVGAFKKSTLLKELNLENYKLASLEFLKWSKITDPITKQKITSSSILARRQRERELFDKPVRTA